MYTLKFAWIEPEIQVCLCRIIVPWLFFMLGTMTCFIAAVVEILFEMKKDVLVMVLMINKQKLLLLLSLCHKEVNQWTA